MEKWLKIIPGCGNTVDKVIKPGSHVSGMGNLGELRYLNGLLGN